MMTIDEVLRRGFAEANRRFGLVFLDLVWKAIWLALTIAGLAGVLMWYGSKVQNIGWPDSGSPGINGVLAAVLLRQFWDAFKTQIYGAVALVGLTSAAAWLLLEGFFRSRMTGNSMRVFVTTAAAKFMVLASTGVMIGLTADSRSAAFAGLVAFTGVVFLLTLVENVIRGGAVELLGADLIRVTSVIGILLSFEAMVAASVAAGVIAGFLNVSRMSEALRMSGVAGVAVVFLNFLHSYLLLVRFSAIDIMRRNVIEI